MAGKPHLLPRSSSMVDRLSRLYGAFQGDDRVLVVINADPDSIASAMALKRILWRRVASVTVARTNIVKRPDNLALVEFIKMPIVPFSEVKVQDFTRLAMVDSQPAHQECTSELSFDVVIDHHPLVDSKTRILDVRPDYGANSTIMTEYLRAAKIKPSRTLATALFYGIKTDTNNFVRQGQMEDMKAFQFLFPLINQNMVNKIENSSLTRASLKYFSKALERVKILKGQALVYMGRVDNPDTLVMMADFFMRIHDISRSFAAGIWKDHLVVILRMAGPRLNAGRLAAEAFGALGSAGGHKAMARAEIPLANLDPKLFEKEGAAERFLLKCLQTPGEKKSNRTSQNNSSH